MAFVTFEDYSGNVVEINPALVQSISTFQHYDHDLEPPAEMLHVNGDGFDEIHPDKRAEVDALRTSQRVIIAYPSGSIVVTGTLAQVKKALA